MATVTFWFLALLTVGSAAVVVQSKKLLYSAYALLFTFVGIAGLYVFLWADFMAVVQIMIYVGGILVLIIIGIMLTHRITSVNISHTSVQKGIGGFIVLGVLSVLGLMIVRTPWMEVAAEEPAQTVASIGTLLMMDYLLPFEVACLLLLGALIGATTLSRKSD
jgi:NADH-quinone oxidoreductase subunit J